MHYYRFANKISSYTLRYRLPEWTFLAIQKGQNINIFKKTYLISTTALWPFKA